MLKSWILCILVQTAVFQDTGDINPQVSESDPYGSSGNQGKFDPGNAVDQSNSTNQGSGERWEGWQEQEIVFDQENKSEDNESFGNQESSQNPGNKQISDDQGTVGNQQTVSQGSSETQESDVEALSNAVVDFSHKFYVELAKTEKSNFVFSPLSMHTSLLLLAHGSTENSTTREELFNALGSLTYTDRLNSAYRNVLDTYNTETLAYGNHIWVQDGIILKDAYADKVKDLNSEISSLKMGDQGSVDTVNKWVSNLTADKIPSLVSELSPDSKVLITNALYLKETWTKRFETSFYSNFKIGDEIVKTTMMERTGGEAYYGKFKFGSDHVHEILRLPYNNSDLEMHIILPSNSSSLAQIENNLDLQIQKGLASDENRFRLFKSAQEDTDNDYSEIFMRIPQFETEANIDATSVLENLGVKAVFSGSSELGEMVSKQNLKVEKVVHKALISVDYGGTEAAAATFISLVPLSANFGEIVNFLVDRPFIFLVYDKANEIPILIGRILDPTQLS